MKAHLEKLIKESIEVKQALLSDAAIISMIENAGIQMIETLKNGGRILLCGNGGSAADAQHIAAELTGHFMKARAPLSAQALGTNFSHTTSVANDVSFDEVYSRLVLSEGRQGDVLIAISTSGNSSNIVSAAKTAFDNGLQVIGLTGSRIGKLDAFCHHAIKIPSTSTPRIQESHILVGHLLCGIVEDHFFGA